MSNQEAEKNQLNKQSDSNPVINNTETQIVDDDYGLKKLTIYTVLFSITCLAVAGIWYKKDEIPFEEISNTSVEIYDVSSKFITENYNTIMNSLLEEKTVITDTATTEPEVSLSDDTVEITTPDSTTITEVKATEEIVEPAVVVDTTQDETISTESEVISDEIITEDVVVTEASSEAVDITENAVEEVNDTVVLTTDIEEVKEAQTSEINTEVTVINATDVTDIDIATTETTEAEITITETQETKAIIETADRAVTDKLVEVAATPEIKAVTTPAFNQPARGIYQAPRGYAYAPAPYRYSGPAVNMPFNNMARNNMPRNYMPQNNRMLQQPQTFEQNMQMQQQMMQQAMKMQSAIFKDADRRHQEMLKRVAEWKVQAQERRDAANARYKRPAYMN
ncbi:MAG: hypothetical protein DIZ80_17030 [endosymbiont of Galathealinum brachiosum]|uniref:Uncharacterized protein n=1 Tax=endosymbiont of Galathealinum brachiosum TaxID=2200906 RepID=A0A370D6U0_9GAMM|nr:MAG: hypothetical protein DIZ80_17030 [endosymbiont of Galathealinum brachiosum]